ncbi:MAG: T9SS type A sorting domain-containing protein [Flavobacteriales bacterium]|jgi:hypothetical protein|nr:T9SS type A sorting domain-containing protein [Flavobacteriales bacterium]
MFTPPDKEEARARIAALVARFREQHASYKRADYKETQVRRDFIDPFFKALAGDMFTAIAGHPAPAVLELLQNQPNPASGRTTIAYRLPLPGPVSLRLHDLHGRLVSELEHGTRAAGMHTRTVDLSTVEPGVYFYTLRSAETLHTRKLVVE